MSMCPLGDVGDRVLLECRPTARAAEVVDLPFVVERATGLVGWHGHSADQVDCCACFRVLMPVSGMVLIDGEPARFRPWSRVECTLGPELDELGENGYCDLGM